MILNDVEYYFNIIDKRVQARVKALAKYNKKQKNRIKLKNKKG